MLLDKDLDVSIFENIESFYKLDDKFKKILIDNGYIIDEKRDELEEIKYMFEKTYFDEDLLNVVLVPSLNCNFKCPYCFEKDHLCGKQDIKNYFKVLKKFAEKHFKLHKCVQISLFGGEPLLYIKQFLEFLNWVKKDAKKNKYMYLTSIVTNGSLLTEKIIDDLLEHNLFSLQITIDSDKKTHDSLRIFKDNRPSFELLINNIKLLINKTKDIENFQFNMRINLSNTNVNLFKETLLKFEPEYRQYINLLIRAVYKTHVYQEENCNKVNELKVFYEVGKELGFKIIQNTYHFQSCEGCADSKFFYLMPDLTMWKCINDLSFKKACFGRIGEDGEPIIDPINVVNWYKNASSCFNDEKCMDCKLLPDCLGGCILHNCKQNKKSCKTFDMASLPYIY